MSAAYVSRTSPAAREVGVIELKMEERSSVQREDRGDRKERKREKKISEEGRGRERGGRSDITSAKEAGGKGTALWLGCGR